MSTAYGDSFTRHRLEVDWTGMHRDDPLADDKHWRGFWREGVAEGVLVEFEGPSVDWVVGIEVARDWRLLARKLAERNAKTKALNAR